jgi:hypothetical protein
MATTLMPLDPAVSPERVTRLLTISARLLPEEIIAARRARRTRGWVIVVVAVFACLCGMWAVYADRERQAADKDLTAATTEVVKLQDAQRRFSEVVKVRSDTTQLNNQLTAVMANDLDWAALLDTLRRTGATSDIKIDGVNGKLAATGTQSTDSANALPSTAKTASIGSLVVTGTGPDKDAVAAYADKLAKLQTLIANPYVTSVASDPTGVTFSLTVDITQASLCGRFSAKQCPSAGGN